MRAKPAIEPLLVIVAIALDFFVGKVWFTTLFGWWLFMCVAINIPGLASSALLMKLRTLDAYNETAPLLAQNIRLHKTFMLCTAYAFFLHYWWRWL